MREGAATADLELRLRWLTVTVVAAFGIALLAGTVLSLVSPGSLVALKFFQTGLVLLMAAPAVRILIAVAERIRRHDWTFVVMTLVVLVELSIVLWRAAAKS